MPSESFGGRLLKTMGFDLSIQFLEVKNFINRRWTQINTDAQQQIRIHLCRNPAGSPDRNLTVLDSQTTRMPLRGGGARKRRDSGRLYLRFHQENLHTFFPSFRVSFMFSE